MLGLIDKTDAGEATIMFRVPRKPIVNKQARIERYLEFSREQGTLTP